VSKAERIHDASGRAQSSRTLRISEVAPPRGGFLLRRCAPGGHGPGHAAPHAEPLPLVYGVGRAPAAARHFPAPRRGLIAAAIVNVLKRQGVVSSPAKNSLLPGQRFRRLRPAGHLSLAQLVAPLGVSIGFLSALEARPDALLDCHAAPHRPLLPHHILASSETAGDHPRWCAPINENLETTPDGAWSCSLGETR